MNSSDTEQKLKSIIQIEQILSEIQDLDILFERLLTEARRIVHADAGSIYVVENDLIKIKYAQNDTKLKKLEKGSKLPYVYFSLPISEKSIAGYCVISGKMINIPDVYKLDPNQPFSFNKSNDLSTDYRTQSMLTLPLKMSNGRILGVLQIINSQNKKGEVIPFDQNAELYLSHFASNAAQALEHAYLNGNMIKRMQKMAQYRDPKETFQHVERVASFSLEIYDKWASNHGISEEEKHKFRDDLKIAAKCHDFGKVGISDVILKKVHPRLTDDERNIMKGHTCVGALLFTEPESSADKMCLEVTLRHHEWWDGSNRGYPGKLDYSVFQPGEQILRAEPLKGEEIPLSARIVALADVFDALSHKRTYKLAWSLEDSFEEIQKLSGSQFDPEVVEAFFQIKERICAINQMWELTSKEN